MKFIMVGLIFVALNFSINSYAATVTSTLTSLGGSDYRYDYTIENDGSLGIGIALELIDIDFDTALYDEGSLSIVTSAPLSTDWDEIILASAPGIPAVYDLFALAGGIADGDTVAGFTVEFTWLGGTEGPGDQAFQIFDPNSFALLETGTTTTVPVPGALLLLSSGLAGLGFFTRKTRRGNV